VGATPNTHRVCAVGDSDNSGASWNHPNGPRVSGREMVRAAPSFFFLFFVNLFSRREWPRAYFSESFTASIAFHIFAVHFFELGNRRASYCAKRKRISGVTSTSPSKTARCKSASSLVIGL